MNADFRGSGKTKPTTEARRHGEKQNHNVVLWFHSPKIDEMVYGPEHRNWPATSTTWVMCSVVLVTWRERDPIIRKKVLGDDHPKTRLMQRLLDALAIKENKQKKSR